MWAHTAHSGDSDALPRWIEFEAADLFGMMGDVVPMVSLLERDEQIAQLRSAVDVARAGAGRLIVVTGEAGVGKTALVESVGDFDGQVRRWTGSCEQLLTARPLGPLADIALNADGRQTSDEAIPKLVSGE